jgi:hypothetical protein
MGEFRMGRFYSSHPDNGFFGTVEEMADYNAY